MGDGTTNVGFKHITDTHTHRQTEENQPGNYQFRKATNHTTGSRFTPRCFFPSLAANWSSEIEIKIHNLVMFCLIRCTFKTGSHFVWSRLDMVDDSTRVTSLSFNLITCRRLVHTRTCKVGKTEREDEEKKQCSPYGHAGLQLNKQEPVINLPRSWYPPSFPPFSADSPHNENDSSWI